MRQLHFYVILGIIGAYLKNKHKYMNTENLEKSLENIKSKEIFTDDFEVIGPNDDFEY